MNRRSFSIAAATAIGLTRRFVAAQTSSPVAGNWLFTDDKGLTISLETPPSTLAMDVRIAAPLWDFGVKPDALFGWNIMADGTIDAAGGNIDPAGIPIAGDMNEPIKLEEMINVAPDLILAITWEPDTPDEYGDIDLDLVPQVRKIAPILGMSVVGRIDENLGRMVSLAEALGADLSSDELVQAKSAYESSLTAFTEAAAASDLVSMFVYIGESESYIAYPPDWGDVYTFSELGLDVVSPDVNQGDYWQIISNELVVDFPADVLFVSARDDQPSKEELQAMSGWKAHPAVAAGQIFPWNQDFIQSYQGMKTAFDVITEAVTTSKKVS